MKKTYIKTIPEFYDTYIALVDSNTDIIEALQETMTIFDTHFDILSSNGNYRYAPQKWTLKEVLQHIVDTERIFSYRALAISRLEQQPLVSFDENMYAKNAYANNRSVEDILREYKLVRQATIALFGSFNDTVWHIEGNCASKKISVLAAGFIMTGHAIHHVNVMKTRYFSNIT